MKKYFFLFLLTGFIASGNNNDSLIVKKTEQLKKELRFFSDSIMSYYYKEPEYLVFVANLYNLSDKKQNYCFTLGYVRNSNEYPLVSANYYYIYNNCQILFKIKESDNKKFIKKLGLKKVTKTDSLKLIKKLFPSESGGFTYRGKGLVVCKEGNNYEKTFYSNSDQIPFDKSIFCSYPKEAKIEKIK